jgi:hypothetical protein
MKTQKEVLHAFTIFSLTPGFSPVLAGEDDGSRFNGFVRGVKAAEAARRSFLPRFTGLKPGVNEML